MKKVHLEKKEPTKMVMTLEAMEKQLMAATRERELADQEEVLTVKKSKTTERMEQRENTPKLQQFKLKVDMQSKRKELQTLDEIDEKTGHELIRERLRLGAQ